MITLKENFISFNFIIFQSHDQAIYITICITILVHLQV